jgi:glutaredoxin
MTQSIVVYTSPTCPACGRLKEYLKDRHLEFEERSVTDPKFAKELVDDYRQMSVPFTVVGDNTVTGYAPQELDGLLHGGPLS